MTGPLLLPYGLGVSSGRRRGGGFVQNVPTLALVGSRGMIPQNGSVINGNSYDRTEARIRHRLGRQVSNNLRLMYGAFGIKGAHAGWEAMPNGVTVEAALEAANTAYKGNLFTGGVGSKLIAAGAAVITDIPVVPGDLGLGTFGAGATLFSRTGAISIGAGQQVWGGQPSRVTTAGSREAVLHSTGLASQVMAFGDMDGTGRATTPIYGFTPLALLGNWVGARDLSFVFTGDSFVWGAGDGAGAAGQDEGLNGGGFLPRGAYAVGGAAKTVPWTKWALGGDAIVSALAGKAFLDNIHPNVTDHATNYFYNDIQGAGRTKEQVLADLIAYGQYSNAAGVRFHWCTPAPATTSMDNFATLENQTVNAGYAEAVTFVVAGMTAAYASGALVGGIIDTRSAWADATEPNKWKVNGTANYFVATDNVHASAAGHAAAGAVVSTYMAALSIPGA